MCLIPRRGGMIPRARSVPSVGSRLGNAHGGAPHAPRSWADRANGLPRRCPVAQEECQGPGHSFATEAAAPYVGTAWSVVCVRGPVEESFGVVARLHAEQRLTLMVTKRGNRRLTTRPYARGITASAVGVRPLARTQGHAGVHCPSPVLPTPCLCQGRRRRTWWTVAAMLAQSMTIHQRAQRPHPRRGRVPAGRQLRGEWGCWPACSFAPPSGACTPRRRWRGLGGPSRLGTVPAIYAALRRGCIGGLPRQTATWASGTGSGRSALPRARSRLRTELPRVRATRQTGRAVLRGRVCGHACGHPEGRPHPRDLGADMCGHEGCPQLRGLRGCSQGTQPLGMRKVGTCGCQVVAGAYLGLPQAQWRPPPHHHRQLNYAVRAPSTTCSRSTVQLAAGPRPAMRYGGCAAHPGDARRGVPRYCHA